ncbi:MAG: class I tRNA ligase family protein [Thermoplasmata archaeon]
MNKKKFSEINSYPNFEDKEKRWLEYWEEGNLVSKLIANNSQNPNFSFIDGPITANNPMGFHHVWGRTLKDVIQRFKAMQGYNQRLQNGFDCHGLWVEVETEKELDLKNKKDIENYGIENFSRKCKELTIGNIVAKADIGKTIDLNVVARFLADSTEFEPEVFPSAIMRFGKGKSVPRSRYTRVYIRIES